METIEKMGTYLEDIEVSNYAKFHYAFLGYSFKSKNSGRIYKKSAVWDLFRQKAMRMIQTKQCDPFFELVDSFGWENGHILK